MKPNMEKTDCLIRCHGEHCSNSQCCSRENFLEDTCKSKDSHAIGKKYEKKEAISAAYAINLEKFTIYEEKTEQIRNNPRPETSTNGSTKEDRKDKDKEVQSITSDDNDISSCNKTTALTTKTDDTNLDQRAIS